MEWINAKVLFFSGVGIGIIAAIIMHLLGLTSLAPLAMIVWFAAVILIQMWKCDNSHLPSRQYWTVNKWRCILEAFLGNFGFWIIMAASIYGTYGGNLLR